MNLPFLLLKCPDDCHTIIGFEWNGQLARRSPSQPSTHTTLNYSPPLYRQGNASVLPPPPGVPGPHAQRHEPFAAKPLISNPFTHVPTVQFRSFLTPKMMQFVSVFQACKLLNKCQKMPILITSSLHHFITSTLHHFDASTTSHSTLFVGIFAQKIRNFFTRPLLEISAKSGK